MILVDYKFKLILILISIPIFIFFCFWLVVLGDFLIVKKN